MSRYTCLLMRCFVIMGVAGCGKTSVGEALQDAGLVSFIDGDSLHPPENIAKMSAGQPLDDTDRAPWLEKVGAELARASGPMAIGCSALKRRYRNRIRKGAGKDVGFIHLAAPIKVIEKRMAMRTGHFMPLSLLESQYRDLEPLHAVEAGQVIDISPSFGEVMVTVRRYVSEVVSE